MHDFTHLGGFGRRRQVTETSKWTSATESGEGTAPLTAIVAAYDRPQVTRQTLERILACKPRPSEILVHVDGGNTTLARMIGETFPDVGVLVAEDNVGPGGARSRLIASARNEVVASFDDDSFPLDPDYFARVIRVVEQFPRAGIVAAKFFERRHTVTAASREVSRVMDFTGCACIYRRAMFLQTRGYVARPIAYGVEESDLALQFHARNMEILFTPYLRVYHDTDLSHRRTTKVSLCKLENIFLLGYLRLPRASYPVVAWRALRYAAATFSLPEYKLVVRALGNLPVLFRKYRVDREPVSIRTYVSYLWQRRRERVIGAIDLNNSRT